MNKKTFACPNCGKHVTIKGKPGQKKIIKCPKCGEKGVINFKKHKTTPKTKESLLPTTKKQKITYTTAIIIAILLIIGIIIPVLQGSLHFLTVLSGSMEPTIPTGSIVVTQASTPKDVQVNDIITFKQPSSDNPNKLVTHRVVNITQNNNTLKFQTKGDNNEDPDTTLVPESKLVGKVTLTLPYLGYLPHYAQKPIGFIILIIIPGSLLIVNEVWNIKNQIQKNKREEK